jgi:hypothetical protein
VIIIVDTRKFPDLITFKCNIKNCPCRKSVTQFKACYVLDNEGIENEGDAG